MSLSYEGLIRPYGLADGPWGVPAAAVLIAILGCLGAIEFLTPDVVVGALAVLPILAAVWLLSTRAASATAATARWCAAGLAVVVKTQAPPPQTTPEGESDKSDRLPWGGRLLTSREEDVARLAIAGYRSAEIAQRLHIGRRTVESHLAGVYSKLGIRSRVQLITMAAASSITSPEQHS
jgi:DNA-binding CsgD family transcriptional regulator